MSCEDTVSVLFFPLHFDSATTEWENLCEHINSSLKLLGNEYIWHREELKVCLPIINSRLDLPLHLMSTTCFGDNIEDEWFIVYLIMKISQQFKDIIIQITDNDGDFLLIEAANNLPSWANPESTENRVFIFNGQIHLIPPALCELNTELKLKNALNLITQHPEETIATNEIQSAISSRIQQYPGKIKEHFQKAIVKLPLEIAALLRLRPSFISAIVEAYCNYDMLDSKYCCNVEFDEYVHVEVQFTKCLYAMLMHAKLFKNIKLSNSGKKDKSTELGMKLTCGYQILVNKSANDIFSSKDFSKYINNLKANGYFRDNIEDSKDYNRLLVNAKKYFVDMECPLSVNVSRSINEVLTSDVFLKIKENLKRNKLSKQDLVEDSDDWLNINPNQLNELLESRYGEPVNFDKDDTITPEVITSKLTNFLKKSSDFEGIETREEFEDSRIQFDPDDFVTCLERMMNLLSNNKEDIEEDSDVDYDSDISYNKEEDLMDRELASKLNLAQKNEAESKTVLLNITQSLKEEGLSGPSSNLLKTIGINKIDMLDSDDD